MDIGHRIRSGTQTVAAVTSTYALSNLAKQSDQGVLEWVVNSTIPEPARVRTAISGKRVGDGYYSFQWTFTLMSFGQYEFWCDSFLPSDAWSAAVTVMTYDRAGVAQYLQCTIQRPTELQLVAIGYRDVTWQFTHGVIIT